MKKRECFARVGPDYAHPYCPLVSAAKKTLARGRFFLNDALVQPKPSRRGRKWQKFVRENRSFFFMFFFLILILALVVLFFWMIGSMRFIKPS